MYGLSDEEFAQFQGIIQTAQRMVSDHVFLKETTIDTQAVETLTAKIWEFIDQETAEKTQLTGKLNKTQQLLNVKLDQKQNYANILTTVKPYVPFTNKRRKVTCSSSEIADGRSWMRTRLTSYSPNPLKKGFNLIYLWRRTSSNGVFPFDILEAKNRTLPTANGRANVNKETLNSLVGENWLTDEVINIMSW